MDTKNMNTKSEWSSVRSKIKARFGKLSEDEIDSLENNLDLLPSKLQAAYGYTKERSESEFRNFMSSLKGDSDKDKSWQAPTYKENGSKGDDRNSRERRGQEREQQGGHEQRGQGREQQRGQQGQRDEHPGV